MGNWYDDYEDSDFEGTSPNGGYVSSRKAGRPLGPDAPHYPNAAERALLTKLMREGQCSEEEVRSRKENRVALAEAAKSMSRGDPAKRRKYEQKMRRRRIAQAMGVLPTDPRVTVALNSEPAHTSWIRTLGYMSRFFR